MSQPPAANQPPQSASPAPTPAVVPGFEADVQAFWVKNRSFVLFSLAIFLLVLVGRDGWQYLAAMRERGVQEDFAKAAGQADRLASFADDHASHSLGGVAYVQLADQEYQSGQFKQAAAHYARATSSLKNDVLLGRARLGAAMSQINGGDKAAGEAELKAIGADTNLLKAIRAEATYHLTEIAFEAGRTEEVRKLVEEIGKIDLTGAWSQRATLLLTSLPTGGKPAEPSAAAITFKPAGG